MTELGIEKLHEMLKNGEVTSAYLIKEALEKSKKFKPKHFKSETDHMIKLIEDFIDNN